MKIIAISQARLEFAAHGRGRTPNPQILRFSGLTDCGPVKFSIFPKVAVQGRTQYGATRLGTVIALTNANPDTDLVEVDEKIADELKIMAEWMRGVANE